MGVMKIPSFGGMIPAQEQHLLPPTAASSCTNTWVYDGTVTGIAQPTKIKTLQTGTTKVYRIPNNYTDTTNLGNATFMEFTNIDTDVLRAPVVGDTYDRYYWVSPTQQAQYNTLARIKAGSASYLLGIPTPGTAPGVSNTGGVATISTTRVYVYTWVSAYGEEGPPSPPTSSTGKIDATSWSITLTPPAGSELTNRNLATVRIYRTVTGNNGVATYFQVAELDKSATSYTDTKLDSAITSNTQLQSAEWTPPPSDLQGWVAMPNGMIAGWRGNEIWFAEPYRPHAWPASYTLAVQYPIVGMGVIGQTLIVCTTGFPTAVTGINPSSMSQASIATYEPCLSRGSILSTPEGVYYASNNGLVLCSNGSVQNITREVINRDAWLKLTAIPTLRAARMNTAYYAFGSARQGAFELTGWNNASVSPSDSAGALTGLLIDPLQPRIGVHNLSSDVATVNVQGDPWSGSVLIVRGGALYSVDLSIANPQRSTWVWRSKVFELPKPDNLGAMQVVFGDSTGVFSQNLVGNDTLVQTLGPGQYGLVRVYANGEHIATRELRQSNTVIRLPSGFKATYWQIEFEARVQIFNVTLASTVKELGNA